MQAGIAGLLVAHIRGQASFTLSSDRVHLALTEWGAHMAPVSFFPDEGDPIEPYAIAPWAEEAVEPSTPAVIRGLRGDWFCSAFGANTPAEAACPLPLHGETAGGRWRPLAFERNACGAWVQLGLELPLQGGICRAITALAAGQTMIYQRHDFSGLTGPIAPGHHATLAFPEGAGAGRLSFSPYIYASTPPESTERPEQGGRSYLEPRREFQDLRRAPAMDGTSVDLCRYPARGGYEDTVLISSDPAVDIAWSAVTVPGRRYVWFALRNRAQLSSTLLWFSNGGRDYPPWSARHVNVLGVEDMTGYFAVGLQASCRPNELNGRGIPTCLSPDGRGRLSIPYIQGVARIPEGFDLLRSVALEAGSLLLTAESGISVRVSCQVDFLRTGVLPGLSFGAADSGGNTQSSGSVSAVRGFTP